jgi:vacuolar-type H+-ATPase subunit E/Vma4
MSDTEEVISGIISEAKAEASKIEEDARSMVEVRRQTLSSRLDRIRSDHQERARAEVERIERRYESAIAVEQRRAALRLEQEAYRVVLDDVKRRFAELVDSSSYDDVLRGWITEALIGLGVEEAVIRTSDAEEDCAERVLSDAARAAGEFLGFSCTASLDRQSPLSRQGVVAVSSDGGTAYNNELATRLSRYEPKLRAIVAEEILESEK